MALKDHAVSCTINPHGGECETCNKWYRHEKLREHYRRKLIRAEKKQACVHATRSCGELSLVQPNPSNAELLRSAGRTQLALATDALSRASVPLLTRENSEPMTKEDGARQVLVDPRVAALRRHASYVWPVPGIWTG